jgi:hypothetical protein
MRGWRCEDLLAYFSPTGFNDSKDLTTSSAQSSALEEGTRCHKSCHYKDYGIAQAPSKTPTLFVQFVKPKDNAMIILNLPTNHIPLRSPLHAHGRLEPTQPLPGTRQPRTKTQENHRLGRSKVVQRVQQNLKMPGKVLLVLG